MSLIYKTLLDKVFDGVPSRSGRAQVVVAKIEGEFPYFIVQYDHHEGLSVFGGDRETLIEELTVNFENIDRAYDPNTDLMINEIEKAIKATE